MGPFYRIILMSDSCIDFLCPRFICVKLFTERVPGQQSLQFDVITRGLTWAGQWWSHRRWRCHTESPGTGTSPGTACRTPGPPSWSGTPSSAAEYMMGLYLLAPIFYPFVLFIQLTPATSSHRNINIFSFHRFDNLSWQVE